MSSRKSSFQMIAQAETLLIYGIFLFVTGLAQIAVTLGHRYIIENNNPDRDHLNFVDLLPTSFTLTNMHLWYIYPSAALTFLPCLCCVLHGIFKRRFITILICIASLISFISSALYVGLLIIHTLEYWQTISSHRFQSSLGRSTSATSSARIHILVPFDEPATFTNLALLMTFTLALVQALLSMIGAVIACLWSPCCVDSLPQYTPITNNSHYAQTAPQPFESPQSSTLRSVKRQQNQENHRFIASNDCQDPVMNGFLHKSPPNRSNYDDV